MKSTKNTNLVVKQKAFNVIVDTLRTKKEIKSRFQNGEKLREIAKEKGLEVVLPL